MAPARHLAPPRSHKRLAVASASSRPAIFSSISSGGMPRDASSSSSPAAGAVPSSAAACFAPSARYSAAKSVSSTYDAVGVDASIGMRPRNVYATARTCRGSAAESASSIVRHTALLLSSPAGSALTAFVSSVQKPSRMSLVPPAGAPSSAPASAPSAARSRCCAVTACRAVSTALKKSKRASASFFACRSSRRRSDLYSSVHVRAGPGSAAIAALSSWPIAAASGAPPSARELL
mmetsp:Transcript_32625/g.100915  ORF Transcript_32625/g.100915 Transcript_32625/m.100915 type:complete len:235 (+) Transcript_32625:1308-2012(+)